MARTPVAVPQANDADIEFVLVVDNTDTPYDLVTGTIELEFFLKPGPASADPSPATASTTGGDAVITDAANGVVVVTLAPADIPDAGEYFYRLDVVRNLRRETVAWGPFTVIDV